MDRKKGTFILNDTRAGWTGRAIGIHVIAETTFTAIRDTRLKDETYYISTEGDAIPAGTYIVARDGAQFSNIVLTNGAIEIIF
jgi:hypothetical protein